MELQNIGTETTWNDAASRINSNNAKIDVEVTKLQNATYKNKGYFSTLSALQEAFPTASAGCKAYVGSTYPYAIYVWDGDTYSWVDSGNTGSAEITFFEFEVDTDTMTLTMKYELWGGGQSNLDFTINDNGDLILTI